jgi:hypothetical protein
MKKNTKTATKEFENKLTKDIFGIINSQLEEFEEVVEGYYENNKDFFEGVVFKSETKPPVYKRIPTKLEINHDKENLSLNISIGAETAVENKILKAQRIGTGLSIDDEILKYFDIDKQDTKKKEDLSDRYFDPKPTDIVLKNDLKTLLNGKKG